MIRMQFDFTEEKVKELDELMKELQISTRKELINNALTFFEWAVEEKRKGKKIGSFSDKHREFTELIMPSLQNVKKDKVLAFGQTSEDISIIE